MTGASVKGSFTIPCNTYMVVGGFPGHEIKSKASSGLGFCRNPTSVMLCSQREDIIDLAMLVKTTIQAGYFTYS